MIPEPLKKFIDLFAKFPGIGPRQASRIGFWLVRQPKETRESFQKSLEDVAQNLATCEQCNFPFTRDGGETLCHICRDATRDHATIAVVEKETDLVTIEKSKKYRGLYHILGGTLSPVETAKDDPRLQNLAQRIKNSPTSIGEVILALSATSDGDYTALELERALSPLGAKITRLGRGIPRGGELEFADEDTIAGALEGRR